MRKLLNSPSRLIRCAAAVAAGLLFSSAFPNWNFAGAAWLAPGLLLFSAAGARSRGAFALGFIGGLVHALTSLNWLLNIPFKTLGLPLMPGLGWVALSAYVALYPAVWVWLCWKLLAWRNDAPSIRELADHGAMERAIWTLVCGAAWAGLEIVRFRFLSGFPWNPLGASQYHMLPLIQVAAFGGVHAVSFLVAWTSVSIVAALAVMLVSRPARPIDSMSGAFSGSRDVFLPILAVGLCASFGMHRIFSTQSNTREIKLALIQPSIPQTLIWDPNANAERFKKVMELSKQALASKPDVVVWPESALPESSRENLAALGAMAQSNHVWIILCADDVDPPSGPGQAPKYYNASFLFSPEGRAVERYRKSRLVIFGEYIPLVKWLPFLKWFVPADLAEGSFTAGAGPVPFTMTQPDAEASPLICFEDVFPVEARRHVTLDTDFLLNLTNDGWFGRGAAQWQQAAAGLFRAVENGVPLVRCTNDGLTCWIDEVGRIRQIFSPEDIYGPGCLIARVPLPEAGTRTATYYNLRGDVFGWACVALTVGLALMRRLRARASAGAPE